MAIKKASSNGAVVAADSWMKDVTAKHGGYHDTLMQAITDGEEKVERLVEALASEKAAAAKELEQVKTSLTRQLEEWKAKAVKAEEKVRAAFGKLAE